MRKIIAGKAYDTETASMVCDISGNYADPGNFRYDDTQLYRTPKGRFFIAGRGGPLSRWAVSTGQNSWSGGWGIEAIDADEARELVERHGEHDVYADLFGAPEAA